MARLVIERLSKNFRGPRGSSMRALEDFSLIVESGELLAVLGPSGCGKSTLLRLLAGLEQPDAGSISLEGLSLAGVRSKDRDMAMVFQNHALYPHFSVRENLELGLKLRRVPVPEMRRRVGEAAEWLALASLLDRRPGELSGGERQRVALGRALVRRPKVFLLDEPLANLDAPLRSELGAEIVRLHAHLRATMLFVTHDQEEAMRVGQRLAVMNAGRLQQVADARNVYRRPANRFVAGFIGSPPMNFFRGRLKITDRALEFRVLAPAPGAAELGWPIALETPVAALASQSGRECVLGLRPEHLSLLDGEVPDRPVIRGTVDSVQTLGWTTWVRAFHGSLGFTCRAPAPCPVQPGQVANFGVDTAGACLFDPESGAALA